MKKEKVVCYSCNKNMTAQITKTSIKILNWCGCGVNYLQSDNKGDD